MRKLRPTSPSRFLFAYVVNDDFIELFPKGCINLHPALLPHNRGRFPNIWSIVSKTPAGVTLHYIDEGIDTGDVIAQKEVPVEVTDTGAELFIAGLRLKDWSCSRRLGPRSGRGSGGAKSTACGIGKLPPRARC